MPRDRDIVLEVDCVTKRYGAVLAMSEVSFVVERGSFVCLLGPSGCGKTTTLRVIAGFERPDTGRLSIGGEPMSGIPPYRRPVNTVFQDYGLFPHMNVFDNVAFGPRLRNVRGPKLTSVVKDMLDLVRLSGREDRRPHELSGGQQQRVALARALANQPMILLLDEPLSNLDYKLRKEMRVELKRIQREVKITFVLVTHDQEEALSMADRIIVMNGGEIEQAGTPVELYRSPRSLFVANFIGTSNVFRGAVERRSEEGVVSVRLEGLNGSSVRCRGDWPEGAVVSVCVRTQSLRLSRERPDSSTNRLLGRVVETLYLGDYSELVVRAGEHALVQCRETSQASGRAAFDVGEEVWVSWRPEDCSIFAAGRPTPRA